MISSPEQNLQRILNPSSAVKVKLQGRFKAIVRRNGDVVQETPWFSNMILDQGLDYLGTMSQAAGNVWPNGPMGFAHVGTGTTPVTAADTQLSSFLLGVQYAANNYYESAGAPTYEATAYQYYTFAQGAVTTSITEVGISRTILNGQLFSRAIITDSFGNPNPLAITAQDQLTIVYALTFVPTTAPVNGSVVLNGTTYNWQAYMTSLTNFGATTGNLRMPNPNSARPFMGVPAAGGSGVIQATFCAGGTPLSPTVLTDNVVPGAPSQTDITSVAGNTTYSYTAGSHTAHSTLLVVPGSGNLTGGIQSAMVRFGLTPGDTSFRVLYYFSAPIPKLNTMTLQLGFTVSWSR